MNNAFSTEKEALRECGRTKRHQADRARIVRLWQAEGGFWTQRSIADVCRCSVATVRKVLREEGFEEVFWIQGEIVRKIWRERR